MNPKDLTALGADLFSTWESAVAFRLFADQDIPTLTVPEQIAARLGDRILGGTMQPGDRIAAAGASHLREGMKVSDLGDALGARP